MNYLETIDSRTYEEARSLRGFGLYHSKAWHEFLALTFDWKVGCLLQRDSVGNIALLIPIVRKRDLIGSLSDVSLPLSHFVPPLTAHDQQVLVEPPKLRLRIHALVHGKRVSIDNSRVRTLLDISRFSSEDDLFASLRSRSNAIRRKIKIARTQGYTLSTGDEPGTLAEFSRLQAVTRKYQGSPTYPTRFFNHMSELLGDQFRLHVVSKDKRIVAGVAFLYDGNRALYGYGASTRDETNLRHGVNQLAMWGALRQALLDGKKLVDFGTTPKTQAALIAYKEKWGGRTIDCPHSVLEPESKRFLPRAKRLDRESTGIRCASYMIRHMPLPVFRLISPLMLKLVS